MTASRPSRSRDRSSARARRAPACFALALIAACSHDEHASTAAGAPATASASTAVRAPRERTPELQALRRALGAGRIDPALLAHVAAAGEEAPLLEARAAALAGRRLDALRRIEVARARWPHDPEVYATAAEIYAAGEGFDAAWGEIQRGEAQCGKAPELQRAKGTIWISREGGAEKGLELLEEARRADPALDFLSRPLSQAHLLAAKAALAKEQAALARVHAETALAIEPEDVEVRRLVAEARAAALDFDGSVEMLAALVADGEPLESELALTHKRAGIAALLVHQRERALEHFAAAREHGLTDEELSTGARLLGEESLARAERGSKAYDAGDLEGAERLFREALRLDPGAIAARNHLAVVLFRKKDFAGAIELWRGVIASARSEGIELPEPVHMNLAKAQYQAGDVRGAQLTLEEYLDREPGGEWVDGTRAMLALVAEGPQRGR